MNDNIENTPTTDDLDDLNNMLETLEENTTENQVIVFEPTEETSSEQIDSQTIENFEHIVETFHAIPLNSPSILIKETTSRFSDAVWYSKIQTKRVILAGLGGIGSYVGFLLSRMNPNLIVIYDDDVVEQANLSGQLYSKEDVGNKKANALFSFMTKYSNYYSTISLPQKFDNECETSDIMICGFDNMAARKIFFKKWKQHVINSPTPESCLFIDGRLAAEEFQILTIKGDDTYNIKKYQSEYLFSDSEADVTLCSYKQTTFMANMIGSMITNLFVNFVANECNPSIDRDLPFYTSYNASNMYLKIVY